MARNWYVRMDFAQSSDFGTPQPVFIGYYRTVSHMDAVFSMNGTQIAATSSLNGILQFWDSAHGTSQKRIHDRPLEDSSLMFSPNGKEIVAVSRDGVIRVLTTATGIVQKTLHSRLFGIKRVGFAPDGTHIIFGTKEIIMAWDQTRNEDHDAAYCHSAEVRDVSFSPNGKLIASCCRGDISLWDGTNGNFLKASYVPHKDLEVVSVKFSQDCRHIMSHDQYTVQLWDAMTGNLLTNILPDGAGNYHNSVMTSLVEFDLSQDKKWLIICNANPLVPLNKPKHDGVRLISTLTGELIKVLPGNLGSIRSVFSPDGKLVSSCFESGNITLWDIQTGKIQRTLKEYTENFKIVTFSPDSKQLASYSDDKTIKLWDLGEYPKAPKFLGKHLGAHIGVQPYREFQVSKGLTNLEFSPDGQYLITDFERFQLNDIHAQEHAVSYNYLLRLTYRNMWICYGEVPFLVLSQGMESISFDSYKDRVVLGLRDGRVLLLRFDRQKLHSMLVGT